MYYFYLILLIILSVIGINFFFSIRNSRRGNFQTHKLNLSKKFLTFCYSKLKEDKINEEEILKEFLNLLQKIFEARFVTYFSFNNGEGEELKYYSEPFFPYTYGINLIRNLLSDRGLKTILTKDQIYLIEIDQNKHRLSIPISTSSIEDKESKKLIRGINSDTIVLIPIYKPLGIEGVYVVFTKSRYFSKENEAIVNLLIDYVSVILTLSSNKDTLNSLLMALKSGFREIHHELSEDVKSILTNTLLEISNMIDIPILMVDKATNKIVSSNSKYLQYFGKNPVGENLDNVMSKYKFISQNIVFSESGVFEMKKISLPNIDIFGTIFYQSQIIDQKIITETYNELLEIRSYFSFVNKISLVSKNVDIFVRYQPNDKISETGGDISVLLDHEKRTFIGVFDVSGHNISSGFIAMTIKSFVERTFNETKDILITASELNNLLLSISNENINPTYATGIICELDKEKGKLKYICAGHKYGVILKEDSIIDISKISTIDKPFGISSETKFTINNFEVSTGDKIFLYTDGIVEIEDEKGFIIDNSKIIDLIIFCRDFTVKNTINEIFSYINSLKSIKIVDDFLILGIGI